MTLETTGKVDKIQSVRDRDGEARPAADADKQAATNDRLGNFASGRDGDATDDTTGSTLPAGAVPEGVEVVVQAKYGNESRVKVGLSDSPTLELPAGSSIHYRVEDTSQINLVAQSAGDGVNFSHEEAA